MIRKIYLNEYNIPTNDTIYFPYSSGLLQAHAQQFDQINKLYYFSDIFFKRDTVKNIVDQHIDPFLVGFSVSLWNYRLSLKVAKHIKDKYPNCYIVFGGPNITLDKNIFKKYPFIDYAVYGEGEAVFKNILLELPKRKSILYNSAPSTNLDVYPSPYTNQIYNKIIKNNQDLKFKTIIETNRNCPFNCAFCYWGNNKIDNKIKYHSIERVKQEIKWMAQNEIEYIFCADANFGMYKRDIEIAQICANIKKEYNYPEKFRACYGKNVTKNIFETVKILSQSNLAKAATLSVQSFNEKTLNSINRRNIKVKQFKELQEQYNQHNIPTYTEIILGLPNETKQSFLNGLEQAIKLTNNNQIFVYHCQVLPNTQLADAGYQQQYNIRTLKIPLAEVHVTARQKDFVTEYDRIVIQTNTMTYLEWIECTIISWIVQLFHSLGIANKIIDLVIQKSNLNYMNFYQFLASRCFIQEIDMFQKATTQILHGQSRCQIDQRFGNVFYEMEELAYLQIICDKKRFYKELYKEIVAFLRVNNIDISNVFDNKLKKIIEEQKQSTANPNNFSSLEELAIQVILYGRKNNMQILSTT